MTHEGTGRARPWPGHAWPIVLGLVVVGAAIAVVVWRTAQSGSPTGLVHLFYLPITYAGVRFGRATAAAAGTVAGLVSGPLMPVAPALLPVLGAGEQSVSEWAVRLGSFVLVGTMVAWLARQQPRPLEVLARDALLARSLRRAVASGRITVEYQPIVDLGDGRVVGTEALARWTDRQGRKVPPCEFIPVAERTGVIVALGRRVLGLAVRQAVEWTTHAEAPPMVTVNVSAAQLSDPGFPADVAELLASTSLRPQQLCLEITETAIIADPQAALVTVTGAQRMGLRIALDDFGTGQSSLAYLADFPVDILKIDKSFVDEVDTDAKVRALVLAIIEMARALGAVTIGEGIERPSQLAALRSLGCRLGQGYLLGRPVPPAGVDLRSRIEIG